MAIQTKSFAGVVPAATSTSFMSNDSALQQMPDRILQTWFKDVAQAASNPPPVRPHRLNSDHKKYIKTLHNAALSMTDKKIIEEAEDKGFQVIGVTALLKYYYSLAEKDQYCSTTRVLLAFDNSNTSREPFALSFNRKLGSVGPRNKPTVKHLHYEGNLDVVCRALNLAQRNFTSAVIQGWVDWIVECWSTTEVFARENPDFEIGEEDDVEVESDTDDEEEDED